MRVDEMARAGVGVDEMARRLDRHRSTVHRELKRCGGRCGYDAEAAQAARAQSVGVHMAVLVVTGSCPIAYATSARLAGRSEAGPRSTRAGIG